MYTAQQINDFRKAELKADQIRFSADKFEAKSNRETKTALLEHHLMRLEQMKREEREAQLKEALSSKQISVNEYCDFIYQLHN